MAKQTIEIDVPEGMQIGEVKQVSEHIAICLKPIPKTKWRAPTKMDLLGVDEITCRVRDNTGDPWKKSVLVSVAAKTNFPYTTKGGISWKHAAIEVPADEKPPREVWVRHDENYGDPWGAAFPSKEDAMSDGSTAIHMIEVKE